jgi:hypothetical protein
MIERDGLIFALIGQRFQIPQGHESASRKTVTVGASLISHGFKPKCPTTVQPEVFK